MQVWVLRHGEAERHTLNDPERALTERGADDARAAGAWLAGVAAPDLCVLASPYRRAQQTARAVLESLPGLSLATVDWLTPDIDPGDAVRQLAQRQVRQILLVSHQPLVSALIGLLTTGDYRAGPPLGTASLAELEVPLVAAGYATLKSLRHAPDYSRPERI